MEFEIRRTKASISRSSGDPQAWAVSKQNCILWSWEEGGKFKKSLEHWEAVCGWCMLLAILPLFFKPLVIYYIISHWCPVWFVKIGESKRKECNKSYSFKLVDVVTPVKKSKRKQIENCTILPAGNFISCYCVLLLWLLLKSSSAYILSSYILDVFAFFLCITYVWSKHTLLWSQCFMFLMYWSSVFVQKIFIYLHYLIIAWFFSDWKKIWTVCPVIYGLLFSEWLSPYLPKRWGFYFWNSIQWIGFYFTSFWDQPLSNVVIFWKVHLKCLCGSWKILA